MDSFEVGVEEGMEKIALKPKTMGRAWGKRILQSGGETAFSMSPKKQGLYDRAAERLWRKTHPVHHREAADMTMEMIRTIKKGKK